MSHLIIEQGKDVGREIAVPASGMKFGRSPANDLVLEDEAVMLFQGRLFFKSDGKLWITDFSAADKTTVGGEPVDEQALKVGDLIEVGDTAFRVIAVKQAAEDAVDEKTDAKAGAEDDEIDLGFSPPKAARRSKDKKSGADDKGHSLMHRVLQFAVIALLLVVIAVLAPMFLSSDDGPAGQPLPDKQLAFRYECVRGSWNNIFRYYLELTVDGTAVIEVDDLRNRHIFKKAEISEEALETLMRRIAGSGFFNIERDFVTSAPNAYEFYDIAILCNGDFNRVRVLNQEAPRDFEHTVSVLEDFVFSELDVPFTLLEDQESLMRYASQSFKLGEARWSERDVRHGNLAEAIANYREAMVYLETLEPKPELYKRAKQGLERAQAEQDSRYDDFMFNAERAMRLGDWREADKQLRILAELIPDREDERYKTISSKQLEVEEQLR